MQETISFTPQIAYVYGLIFVLVALFITEWVRVDVAALIVVAAIALAGIISPQQVFSGLSSNAVISIGAITIIGTGLDKTEIMSRVVSPIVRLADARPNRLVLYLSSLVALLSSFIQNIGAPALVLPAVQRISRDEGIPISRLLMPIGFSAILGGALTLIGSSPLILLNDLIDPFDMPDFTLFSAPPRLLCRKPCLF